MERGGGGGGCSLSLLSGSKKTEANNELWLFPLLTRVLCGFLFGAEDPYFKILMIASADIRGEGGNCSECYCYWRQGKKGENIGSPLSLENRLLKFKLFLEEYFSRLLWRYIHLRFLR